MKNEVVNVISRKRVYKIEMNDNEHSLIVKIIGKMNKERDNFTEEEFELASSIYKTLISRPYNIPDEDPSRPY